MQRARGADHRLVNVGRREQHVGTRIAIEQEFAFAIGGKSDERKRGACRTRTAKRRDIHAGRLQRGGEKPTEHVIADLSHEGT